MGLTPSLAVWGASFPVVDFGPLPALLWTIMDAELTRREREVCPLAGESGSCSEVDARFLVRHG